MRICIDQRSGTGCGATNPDNASHCLQCGRSLHFALHFHDPGTVVQHYQVLSLIGHGAFGAVYEAVATHAITRRVALKETFEPDSIRSFQREFALLQRLQHVNLPRYDEMFEYQGNGYLVMEFVPGQSLDQILSRQSGPLAETQVLGYAVQVCSALHYLHSQPVPILHRDIKPANIRLTPDGLIKLVDFGLVKQGGGTTRSSRRALTPAYAPLEQWGGTGQHTDARSDIYSLGATLYHLLTGHAPPPATDRAAATTDPLVPPERLNRTLSPHVASAIMQAMSLRQQDRQTSAEALKQALFKGEQTLKITPVPTRTVSVSQPGRFRMPWIVVVLVLLLLGGGGTATLVGMTHLSWGPPVVVVDTAATATVASQATAEMRTIATAKVEATAAAQATTTAETRASATVRAESTTAAQGTVTAQMEATTTVGVQVTAVAQTTATAETAQTATAVAEVQSTAESMTVATAEAHVAATAARASTVVAETQVALDATAAAAQAAETQAAFEATAAAQAAEAQAAFEATAAAQAAEAQAAATAAAQAALEATATAAEYVGGPDLSSYAWVERDPEIRPADRGNYGLVYDEKQNAFVLFGGTTGPALLGDTWEWNGTSWLEQSLSPAPSARQNPAMVYDASRGVVVLFGGKDNTGHLNDTWEYDGATWSKIETRNTPSLRRESCITYDTQHNVAIMFGGTDDARVFRDTWLYDGNDWKEQHTSQSPSYGRLCAMDYDPERHTAVLFGGWNERDSTDETWEWNGADWTKLSLDTHPPARGGHALVYNSKLKRMFLFGGDQGACTRLYEDTWTFDGHSWSKLAVATPGTHSVINAAYSPIRDSILLFGGWSGGNSYCQVTSGTYEFVSGTGSATAIPVQTEVEVYADQGWQDTGVWLDPNTDLTLEVVSGQWTHSLNHAAYNQGEGGEYICANVIPANQCVEPLPQAVQGALIGRIGSSLFSISRGTRFAVSQGGMLELRINDADAGLYDNDGMLTVRVTR